MPARYDITAMDIDRTVDRTQTVSFAEQVRRQLSDMGYAVNYSEYPTEHAVCPAEIADISLWLQQVLA